jgi:hypothetical protein
MLLLFIFFGLTYQDPPPEDGIAINFGYEDDGSGNTEQSAPQQVEQATTTDATSTIDEEVTTQDSEEAPSVTDKQTEQPKETPKEKPKEETKPQPDPRLQNALGKTGTQQGQGQGEGETTGGGDQGDPAGDRSSPNRSGNGGIGNSGNYRLGGRQALNKPKPTYDCPDEGRVVVKIYVDRSGKVISAIPGEKIPPEGPATSFASECLFKRAKEAALDTKWQADPDAPERQVGYIIYNFDKR